METYGTEDLKKIARYQTLACWLILFSLMVMIAVAAVGPLNAPDPGAEPGKTLMLSFFALAQIVIRLGLLIATMIVYYKLAKVLKFKFVFLIIPLLFLPLINLLAVAHIIGKATRVLRAHNIRVGLMGGKKEDLEKL